MCMYVPAAGHISPAIDRSSVGLLPRHYPRPGELVRALTCRFRLCGGTSPCSTSHFGVRVPRRSRTNTQRDRPWSTLTKRWSLGLDVGIQRPSRFDHTSYISRVIQVLMYVIELCMYLLQAISRPPSIGAQSDFFRGITLGQESCLGPSLVAFDSVVGPLHAVCSPSK